MGKEDHSGEREMSTHSGFSGLRISMDCIEFQGIVRLDTIERINIHTRGRKGLLYPCLGVLDTEVHCPGLARLRGSLTQLQEVLVGSLELAPGLSEPPTPRLCTFLRVASYPVVSGGIKPALGSGQRAILAPELS